MPSLELSGPPSGEPAPSAGRGSVTWLLRLEGLALMVAAVTAYSALGGGWVLFALLFLAPDVFMIGYLKGPRIGALVYNLAHTTLAPFVLAALGWFAGWDAAFPIAAIWLAHIGFDRFAGYGLKLPSGFGDTHLGVKPDRRQSLPDRAVD